MFANPAYKNRAPSFTPSLKDTEDKSLRLSKACSK